MEAMYKKEPVTATGPHLEVAEKMFSEIVQMSPAHQNGVVRYITESVKKNRGDEIDNKTKEIKRTSEEIEDLKSLNTEI